LTLFKHIVKHSESVDCLPLLDDYWSHQLFFYTASLRTHRLYLRSVRVADSIWTNNFTWKRWRFRYNLYKLVGISVQWYKSITNLSLSVQCWQKA